LVSRERDKGIAKSASAYPEISMALEAPLPKKHFWGWQLI
jgi:hypothetical protein